MASYYLENGLIKSNKIFGEGVKYNIKKYNRKRKEGEGENVMLGNKNRGSQKKWSKDFFLIFRSINVSKSRKNKKLILNNLLCNTFFLKIIHISLCCLFFKFFNS
jgi:hypothetical protein